MSKLEKIEQSVESLSDDDLKSFAEWFDTLRWQRWDRQIERDAASGKLDDFVSRARAEIAAGKTSPL